MHVCFVCVLCVRACMLVCLRVYTYICACMHKYVFMCKREWLSNAHIIHYPPQEFIWQKMTKLRRMLLCYGECSDKTDSQLKHICAYH